MKNYVFLAMSFFNNFIDFIKDNLILVIILFFVCIFLIIYYIIKLLKTNTKNKNIKNNLNYKKIINILEYSCTKNERRLIISYLNKKYNINSKKSTSRIYRNDIIETEKLNLNKKISNDKLQEFFLMENLILASKENSSKDSNPKTEKLKEEFNKLMQETNQDTDSDYNIPSVVFKKDLHSPSRTSIKIAEIKAARHALEDFKKRYNLNF